MQSQAFFNASPVVVKRCLSQMAFRLSVPYFIKLGIGLSGVSHINRIIVDVVKQNPVRFGPSLVVADVLAVGIAFFISVDISSHAIRSFFVLRDLDDISRSPQQYISSS